MDTNWITVIVCAIAAMVLGFAWYSPLLFGNMWMKLSGMTKEKIAKSKDKMPMIYGTQLLAAIVEAWVLGMFIQFSGINGAINGAMVGLWAWLGFVATVGIADALYNEKDIKLVVINTGYQLAYLLIAGAILASWS